MRLISTLHILVLLVCSLVPSVVLAVDAEDLFTEGNAAYSVGEYDKAIAAFETVTGENGYAPSVLYNLGNSYAQKGMIGKAVLNYERALKLDPSNSDILGNLAKLRKDAGLFTPEMSTVQRFFAVVSIDGWALICLGCLLAIAVLLGCRLQLNPSRKMFGWSAACAIVFFVVAVAGMTYNYSNYNPLIVVQKDVKLLVSPFDGASPVGAIAEGKTLEPLDKDYGEYIYVRDGSGRKGWLHRGAAQAVCN